MSGESGDTQQKQQYERDDVTNIFLERHAVYCEFRSGDLRRKRLHFHKRYELYNCLGGSGSYIVEDKLFPLHAGTLTVIEPISIDGLLERFPISRSRLLQLFKATTG